MAVSYQRSPADDVRVLTVGLSALALGVALGALATLALAGENQALKAGSPRSLADWHDRALDLLRTGREKLERSADKIS